LYGHPHGEQNPEPSIQLLLHITNFHFLHELSFFTGFDRHSTTSSGSGRSFDGVWMLYTYGHPQREQEALDKDLKLKEYDWQFWKYAGGGPRDAPNRAQQQTNEVGRVAPCAVSLLISLPAQALFREGDVAPYG
jgi:hypothetical protein